MKPFCEKCNSLQVSVLMDVNGADLYTRISSKHKNCVVRLCMDVKDARKHIYGYCTVDGQAI